MTDVLPVIMSKPMVMATRRGDKTETRRLADIVKTPEKAWQRPKLVPSHWRKVKPGALLWVRESWRAGYGDDFYREDIGRVPRPSDLDPKRTAIEYIADGENELAGRNQPAIHMPRWASRLTLRVEAVSIERLQEISIRSAMAEGVMYETADPPFFYVPGVDQRLTAVGVEERWPDPPEIVCFSKLWDLIHGAGAWTSNPTVVAVRFKAIAANIDKVINGEFA